MMTFKLFSFFTIIISAFSLLAPLSASTYYVSPSGDDSKNGTIEQPFASWAKAQTAVFAGDTVFFRSGIYRYTSATTRCASQTASVSAIVVSKSGTSGKMIHYIAYPGENPIFDFYDDTCDCRIRGVEVSANYVHFKGLELRGVPQNNDLNHESWCFWITGSNNLFELLDLHHHMGPGLFIQKGDGNLVLNCDSHDNFDAHTSNGAGESADGFGCHTTTVSTITNVFRGCRAWWNADDGFDCISCSGPVLVENCWNWLNGYKAGTTTAIGNGNGFKMGGFGMPPSKYPTNIPKHTVRNCCSFLNRSAGFYQNHHPAINYYYNNTGYKNGVNFNMLGYDLDAAADAGMGIYKNNIAFTGTATSSATGDQIESSANSWNLTGTTVNASDFISIDTAGIRAPRQKDGSLPNIPFLKLVSSSDCINKGIDVGLPFTGSAPDLGAYEFTPGTTVINSCLETPVLMDQNNSAVYDLDGRKLPFKSPSATALQITPVLGKDFRNLSKCKKLYFNR
jgi:hypothetical protein